MRKAKALTDEEVRKLFGGAHIGGHQQANLDAGPLLAKLEEVPSSHQIIKRHHLMADDLPDLYARYHDLVTQ